MGQRFAKVRVTGKISKTVIDKFLWERK